MNESQRLMWLFGSMQRATTIGELDQLFKCICQLLLSPTTPDLAITVEHAIEPEEEEDEIPKPPGDTAVRWQSYRHSTEVGKHFERVKQSVEKTLEDIHSLLPGRRKLQQLVLSIAPRVLFVICDVSGATLGAADHGQSGFQPLCGVMDEGGETPASSGQKAATARGTGGGYHER